MTAREARMVADSKVFDGVETRLGYRLNKFAMSLAQEGNRAAFGEDEEAYMARFDLTEEERQLIRDRDWRAMIQEHGGNIYMIIKIGAAVGEGLYQIGAHQRGETYEEFLATRNTAGAR